MGGRIGGYGLLLTHGFDWWLKSSLLKKIGLGLLILGVLFAWLGKNSSWKRRFGYAWSGDRRLWIGGFVCHRHLPDRQGQTCIRLQHA